MVTSSLGVTAGASSATAPNGATSNSKDSKDKASVKVIGTPNSAPAGTTAKVDTTARRSYSKTSNDPTRATPFPGAIVSTSSSASSSSSTGAPKRGSVASECEQFLKLSIPELHAKISELSLETQRRKSKLATLTEGIRSLNIQIKDKASEFLPLTTQLSATQKSEAQQTLRQLLAAKQALQEKIMEELRVAVAAYTTPDQSGKAKLENQHFSEFMRIVDQSGQEDNVREAVLKELSRLLGPKSSAFSRHRLQFASTLTLFNQTVDSDRTTASNAKEKSAKGQERLDQLALETLSKILLVDDQVDFVIYTMEQETLKTAQPNSVITNNSALFYKALVTKLIKTFDRDQKFDSTLTKLLSPPQERAGQLSPQKIEEIVGSLIIELRELFVQLAKPIYKLHNGFFAALRTFLPGNNAHTVMSENAIRYSIMVTSIVQILSPRLSQLMNKATSPFARTHFEKVERLLGELVSYLRENRQQTLNRGCFIQPRFKWALDDLEATLLGTNLLQPVVDVFKAGQSIANVDLTWWVTHASQLDDKTLTELIKKFPPEELDEEEFHVFITRGFVVAQIIQEWTTKESGLVRLPDDIPGYFNALETRLGKLHIPSQEASSALIEGFPLLEKAVGVEAASQLHEECIVRCFLLFGDYVQSLQQALDKLAILKPHERIETLEKNRVTIVSAHGDTQVNDTLTQLTINEVARQISTGVIIEPWWSQRYPQVAKKDAVMKAVAALSASSPIRTHINKPDGDFSQSRPRSGPPSKS